MKLFKTMDDFTNLNPGDLIIAIFPSCRPLEYRYIGPDQLEEDNVLLADIDGSKIRSYETSFILKPIPQWYYDVSVLDFHTLLKEFYEKELAKSIKTIKENKDNHTRINFENVK